MELYQYIIIMVVLLIIALAIVKMNKKNIKLEFNKLVDLLGGKDNILDTEVEMSRFKVTLKDITKANKEGILKLGAKGVVVIDDQLKIILGSDAKKLKKYIDELNMNPKLIERNLNVGFSGGEKKKNEILQMLVLEPKLVILDETDSGLDVDAVRTVSKGIEMYKNDENAVLIITHNTRILENLKVDYVHILVDGKIVKTGDASLAQEIEVNGYSQYK